jgi:hypothetical protein
MGASKEAPSGTSTAGGSSTPLSTVTQAAEPVTNVVDTVEETVAAAVPPLPVSLPPVPPPPVAPPPPPPLP